MKKYLILSTAFFTTFIFFSHATETKHKTLYTKEKKKHECPLLSQEEKSKAYNEFLPDLIFLANQRADVLEKQIKEIENLGTFGKDFATSWFYALAIAYNDSIGALPHIRENLKTAMNRFNDMLTCPLANSKCAPDLSPGDVAEIMTQILPSVTDNFKKRISLLKKFIKEHPKYKTIAIKNTHMWTYFIRARVEKLKALDKAVDQKVFDSTISELTVLLKEFEKLTDCISIKN